MAPGIRRTAAVVAQHVPHHLIRIPAGMLPLLPGAGRGERTLNLSGTIRYCSLQRGYPLGTGRWVVPTTRVWRRQSRHFCRLAGCTGRGCRKCAWRVDPHLPWSRLGHTGRVNNGPDQEPVPRVAVSGEDRDGQRNHRLVIDHASTPARPQDGCCMHRRNAGGRGLLADW